MFRYMLCGMVVMTACCFGMVENEPKKQSVTHACTNIQCFGPLPGQKCCYGNRGTRPVVDPAQERPIVKYAWPMMQLLLPYESSHR